MTLHPHPRSIRWPRRRVLGTLLSGATASLGSVWVRPARADAAELEAAVLAWAAGAPLRTGGVTLEVAPLVENGNTVPVRLRVDSPMTPTDHVQALALFNQVNPQRDVATFTLGPRSGLAQVDARIRLATSQQLVALARLSDGSVWQHRVDVLVTLAACIE